MPRLTALTATAATVLTSASVPANCRAQTAAWRDSGGQAQLTAVENDLGGEQNALQAVTAAIGAHGDLSSLEAALRATAASMKSGTRAAEKNRPPACIPHLRRRRAARADPDPPRAARPPGDRCLGIRTGPQEGRPLALRSLRPQGWLELYTFTLEPRYLVDYTVANWYISTHPRSAFTRRLIVQKAGDTLRRSLIGDELARSFLMIKRPGRPSGAASRSPYKPARARPGLSRVPRRPHLTRLGPFPARPAGLDPGPGPPGNSINVTVMPR